MLFVSCPNGIENFLLKELQELGIPDLKIGHGGVYAPASLETMYRINYAARLAIRVFWPIRQFLCETPRDLYEEAKSIDWGLFTSLDKTFSVDAVVFDHPTINNSHYAALVVKDALCDFFRETRGKRPDVQVLSPDTQLHLFIHREKALISLDTSGDPLYKRGWRKQSHIAPIQETLAALLLKKTGYTQKEIFCDPFCGSGTFLIEAAMIASHTPSGFFRKSWGFFNHPYHSNALWKKVKAVQDAKVMPLEKDHFFGADKDPKAIDACLSNLQECGYLDAITVERRDIEAYFPRASPTFILTNPPYGKRLSLLSSLYKALDEFVDKCGASGCKLFYLSPLESKQFIPRHHLSSTDAIPHGGLSISLNSFSLDPSVSLH